MLTATRLQAVTYLLGVCLFSIAFLVFLNSSVSFVITDLIGQRTRVGNAVGTLGFADELVVLIACPAWGVISDQLGVRMVSGMVVVTVRNSSQLPQVCALGYFIVGISLLLFVHAKNVFPQLLLARLFFSLGGAATSTMVTAILPSMIAPQQKVEIHSQATTTPPTNGHGISPSISSELTITPQRLQSQASPSSKSAEQSPTRLAGIVGLFTGCGALLSLGIFLRLPELIQRHGVQPGQALADSYYIVGALALILSIICFVGLRHLSGENGKGWGALVYGQRKDPSFRGEEKFFSSRSLFESIKLGFESRLLGLGYLGGFVARASSVGISLFIPLFVNAYYISSGLCDETGRNPQDTKDHCRGAYVLAAELTGFSQLIALIFAPVFGLLADRYRRFNAPLIMAALIGTIGYSALAALKSPMSSGEYGSPWIFAIMALLGISQIGAIVCSLGLLGRGVLGIEAGTFPEAKDHLVNQHHPSNNNDTLVSADQGGVGLTDDHVEEDSPLLPGQQTSKSRHHLKGSIAGVYSLAGGIGILLLTKLGGVLFDKVSPAAPFVMLAVFNLFLLLVGAIQGISTASRGR